MERDLPTSSNTTPTTSAESIQIQSAKNLISNYKKNKFFEAKKYEQEILTKSVEFIKKIRTAILSDSDITICGDYDVDGICSTIMLKEMIEDYAIYLGKNNIKKRIDYHIPSREDGYGLTIDAFRYYQSKGNYVFTLDNGTHKKFLDEVLKNDSKEKIFILDHHPNGDMKEYDFVLNPNDGNLIISTGYLLDYVYEILLKMDKNYGLVSHRDRYADTLALTVVSDMADLNNLRVRNIIKKGLKKIEEKDRYIYQQLFPTKKVQMTFNKIAFDINPKINSIGRLSSTPKDAVTIMSFKKYSENAKSAYSYLNQVNTIRKDALFAYSQKAIEEVAKYKKEDTKNLIFYYNKDIPVGLNGLIAQRLQEIHEVPVMVSSCNLAQGGLVVGSGRGYGIKQILNTIQDPSVFNYGGHELALGFSIGNLESFQKLVSKLNSREIDIKKSYENLTLKDSLTIGDFIEVSKHLSKECELIPFQDKIFTKLKNIEIGISRVFANNFCQMEIKDKTNSEKITYFTKHTSALEAIKNPNNIQIALYTEFNENRKLQDYSGDILVEKNIELSNKDLNISIDELIMTR